MTKLERIDEISEQVHQLNLERIKLEKELRSEGTLKERVEVWENSINKKFVSDLFALKQFPKSYTYFKNSIEGDRYRTYSISESIEDILNDVDRGTVSDENKELLEEIINNNLGSFRWDW